MRLYGNRGRCEPQERERRGSNIDQLAPTRRDLARVSLLAAPAPPAGRRARWRLALSLFLAATSICRTRSRLKPRDEPISLSVKTRLPDRPNLREITAFSFSLRQVRLLSR